jgi:hypothetical protein
VVCDWAASTEVSNQPLVLVAGQGL